MKENILVSACLLGLPCRYDGESRAYPETLALKEKYNLIPFCPEIYGGLPTPRTPSERVGDRVITRDGRDVTENYRRGAECAYHLCKLYGCKKAILKAKSPACGSGKIYDGSFTRTLTDGDGVTAEYLKKRGITVIDESAV
ncbi:MAG: DUF523 domain-containing protein [Clostridia bacterium]|nr:DUF523 domain-containing protein [Clostridia bacterium]